MSYTLDSVRTKYGLFAIWEKSIYWCPQSIHPLFTLKRTANYRELKLKAGQGARNSRGGLLMKPLPVHWSKMGDRWNGLTGRSALLEAGNRGWKLESCFGRTPDCLDWDSSQGILATMRFERCWWLVKCVFQRYEFKSRFSTPHSTGCAAKKSH